jgi:DNA-binding transcriptional MerR regulator
MTFENIRHLPRLSLGEAMQLFGLTARALRFYEEKGLIEARRDRLNYRYYDGSARKRLAWISPLRAAGVSLSDIEDVLTAEEENSKGRDCAVAKLERRRNALRMELAKIDAAIEAFDGQDVTSVAARMRSFRPASKDGVAA